MEAIEAEFEKMAKKQKLFHRNTSDQLTSLLKKLQQTKQILAINSNSSSESGSGNDLLQQNQQQIISKVNECNSQIQSSVKEYYSAIGKLTKSIDKKFSFNLDLAGRSELFDGKDAALNQALALHLAREGLFDLCNVFVDESKVALSPQIKQRFAEMFQILASLKQKNLQPALQWCRDNQHLLERRHSSLEFQLHKLQFIVLLTAPSNSDNSSSAKRTVNALKYARSHFTAFGDRHLKEIQRLMASMAYVSSYPWFFLVKAVDQSHNTTSTEENHAPENGLSQSPYNDISSPSLWEDIETLFTREFCALLGFPQESPLKVTIDVGASAIPTMIKLRSVLDDRRKERPKVEMWSVSDELPVEIPLSRVNRYHSVFSCPVSRDQTSRTNPPMMLVCGHVISKESLIKLAKGGTKPPASNTNNPLNNNNSQTSGVATVQGGPNSIASITNETGQGSGNNLQNTEPVEVDILAGIVPHSKIKCPYCPTETIAHQATVVYF